jgi:hypothetical protein
MLTEDGLEAMPGRDCHPPRRDLGWPKATNPPGAEGGKRLREQPKQLFQRFRLAVVLRKIAAVGCFANRKQLPGRNGHSRPRTREHARHKMHQR